MSIKKTYEFTRENVGQIKIYNEIFFFVCLEIYEKVKHFISLICFQKFHLFAHNGGTGEFTVFCEKFIIFWVNRKMFFN